MAEALETLTFTLTRRQFTLLEKLAFPTSQAVLSSAVTSERGWFELTGTRRELESLVGWVAGEANAGRPGRRQDDLHEIADALEHALAPRGA